MHEIKPVPFSVRFRFLPCTRLVALLLFTAPSSGAAWDVSLDAPASVARFDPAEFTLRVAKPGSGNPFTDVELTGEFWRLGGSHVRVVGFVDAQDGTIFRVRFCPDGSGATYKYSLSLKVPGLSRQFTGELRCEASDRPGPVIVDPEHRKHFVRAGSRKPFHHLGYTAYHLLDPSHDDAQVEATIDYCAREGFNKIRFLLTGYPRDFDRRTSTDVEHGVPEAAKRPNYGAPPGSVNALPAWLGEPHRYDFTRFNVAHWQRIDRAVQQMRRAGIIATCIVTIEKQDLPVEYGTLTDAELRLYRYAVARLAAYDNVWWDIGNEHNEYRDARWGDAIGSFVRALDPFKRLASAHAYAEFFYAGSPWADFIITQQYGQPKDVHDWVLRYRSVPKPYVNEEYGYEGRADTPGHDQKADRVRRCHWSIAMGGGYATYGDGTDDAAWYYQGIPGPGVAARQLKHLRAFFEALPFREMSPHDELATGSFCLARPASEYVLYLPAGGECSIQLPDDSARTSIARWFDPRTGDWQPGPRIVSARLEASSPSAEDWVLLIESSEAAEK